MAEEIKGQPTTNAPPQTPIVDLPPEGGIVAGSANVPAAGSLSLPAGGITLGSGDDVNANLQNAQAAFGSTIASVCDAIARSQKGLDKSLLDSINKLADTKVTMLSHVEIEIGDD